MKIAMVAVGMGLVSQAHAELIASESFESNTNELDPESGFGWDGPWYDGVEGSAYPRLNELGLEFSGEKFVYSGSGKAAHINGKLFRNLESPIEVKFGEPKTIWVGALVNMCHYRDARRRSDVRDSFNNIGIFGMGGSLPINKAEYVSFGITMASQFYSDKYNILRYSTYANRYGMNMVSDREYDPDQSVTAMILGRFTFVRAADEPNDVLISAEIYIDPKLEVGGRLAKEDMRIFENRIENFEPISAIRLEAGHKDGYDYYTRDAEFMIVDEIRVGTELEDIISISPFEVTPYISWSEALPAGLRDPADDADGDGILNGFEFLYQTDPLVKEDASVVRPVVEGEMSGKELMGDISVLGLEEDKTYKILTYRLPKDTRGMTLSIEASTRLEFGDDTAEAHSFGAVEDDGDFEIQKYYLTPSIDEAPKLFWRLSTTLIEPEVTLEN
ncbi:hypothetical protein [Luteolibacter pohnpeiensis]|uniref:hypothetical protein n=1 Tax=Luteolibacter pohnpeiensis TaxID=454153 RepID=UPI00190701A3|nr:hypothetical protein [Luteolibacter pohnpeiensis]